MVGKEQSSALCLDVYSDLRAFSDIDSKTYAYCAIFSEISEFREHSKIFDRLRENRGCLALEGEGRAF